MIEIQLILDALGVVACAMLAVCTNEWGYLVAAIWAMTSFVKDLDKYFDEL